MATNLRGVMAALLTPFDQQQALDKASLRRLVQFNIQQGIDGLYVGGSTGEAFVQSLSEREQVLEIVAEEAKGQIKLILSALKNTAITIGQLLIRRMVCRWWCTTFQP